MEPSMLQQCLFPQLTLCMPLPDMVPSSPNVLLALLSFRFLPLPPSFLSVSLLPVSRLTAHHPVFPWLPNYAISQPD